MSNETEPVKDWEPEKTIRNSLLVCDIIIGFGVFIFIVGCIFLAILIGGV